MDDDEENAFEKKKTRKFEGKKRERKRETFRISSSISSSFLYTKKNNINSNNNTKIGA
jgi:hypothetical protein